MQVAEPSSVEGAEPPRDRSAAVARHYDELDRFYREIWGEHVHHGLWRTGRESPEEAVEALVETVADRAGIGSGDRVCDVGSGYGATARYLARERDARVTALTLSPEQHRRAIAARNGANPRHLLRDWLDNGLPGGAFDAVVAIESLEHMHDPGRALAEARRVLAPAGRLVICSWLAAEDPSRRARRHLLEPVVGEGRLAWLPTAAELVDATRNAGFAAVEIQDLTPRVRRTWTICLRRLAVALLRRPDYRRFLLDGTAGERVFALTMGRIWLAYRVGAMRYGMLRARVPHESRRVDRDATDRDGGADG